MSATTFPASPLAHADVRAARERFVEKIEIADDPSSCWEWRAGRSRQGYGRFQLRSRASVGAHRVSYALFVGDLKPGETVDDLCRNRACVNPWHLEAVSIAENVMRGDGACARHARRENCATCGGAYSIKRRYDGGVQRYCRECSRAYQREWMRSRRAAA